MRAFVQRLIDWLLRAEIIDGAGATDTYLKRWWLLALPGKRRVYLHRFTGSDWARDLHDHPKAFWSIGLRGGYVEETPRRAPDDRPLWLLPLRRRRWVAPWIRRFPATHIHRLRVNRSRPTWTIVITGSEEREWGFWTARRRWVHWREYVSLNGGTAA
ncbi:MAG: hypothetical protein F4Y03_09465 [Alphaproteobacteria bacterium]|nr:hypothetical protein [Alphaproteobacteria bacterium]